jgi:hypothetical protein
MYIANAFSLQMLTSDEVSITVGPAVGPQAIKSILLGEQEITLQSAIGHADTAAVVSADLGVELPMARVNVQLHPGDELLVAQVIGGRLPEGCKTLPDGVRIVYRVVSVHAA